MKPVLMGHSKELLQNPHSLCSDTHVRLPFDPGDAALTRNPSFQSHMHRLSYCAPHNSMCQITVYVEVMLQKNQHINRTNDNYYNINH